MITILEARDRIDQLSGLERSDTAGTDRGFSNGVDAPGTLVATQTP
jgi:hypothetical protein